MPNPIHVDGSLTRAGLPLARSGGLSHFCSLAFQVNRQPTQCGRSVNSGGTPLGFTGRAVGFGAMVRVWELHTEGGSHTILIVTHFSCPAGLTPRLGFFHGGNEVFSAEELQLAETQHRQAGLDERCDAASAKTPHGPSTAMDRPAAGQLAGPAGVASGGRLWWASCSSAFALPSFARPMRPRAGRAPRWPRYLRRSRFALPALCCADVLGTGPGRNRAAGGLRRQTIEESLESFAGRTARAADLDAFEHDALDPDRGPAVEGGDVGPLALCRRGRSFVASVRLTRLSERETILWTSQWQTGFHALPTVQMTESGREPDRIRGEPWGCSSPANSHAVVLPPFATRGGGHTDCRA